MFESPGRVAPGARPSTAGAGWMVSEAVFEVPARVAVIVTVVAPVTEDVVTVKVAEVVPEGTVTLAGTDATGPEEDSATTVPPAGAPQGNVTGPIEFRPARPCGWFRRKSARDPGGPGR